MVCYQKVNRGCGWENGHLMRCHLKILSSTVIHSFLPHNGMIFPSCCVVASTVILPESKLGEVVTKL